MILKVNNITKKIGNAQILKNISFNIEKGECVALIGPNGAGKTTLFNILLGKKFPTSGNFLIDNKKISDSGVKEILGILPQENVAPKRIKVKELVDFYMTVYHDNCLTEQEIYELLGFNDKQKNQLVSKLSGGQRRFLTFILILIGKPKILFLDEPTTAMDTSTRRLFWDIVNKLKAQGVTIIYSSHYIEEVEHTADRVLMLNKGELIRDTTPYSLKSEKIDKVFTLPKKYIDLVDSFEAVSNLEVKVDNITFSTSNASAVWDKLKDAGCVVEEIEIKNITLLDSLFNTTKEDL